MRIHSVKTLFPNSCKTVSQGNGVTPTSVRDSPPRQERCWKTKLQDLEAALWTSLFVVLFPIREDHQFSLSPPLPAPSQAKPSQAINLAKVQNTCQYLGEYMNIGKHSDKCTIYMYIQYMHVHTHNNIYTHVYIQKASACVKLKHCKNVLYPANCTFIRAVT